MFLIVSVFVRKICRRLNVKVWTGVLGKVLRMEACIPSHTEHAALHGFGFISNVECSQTEHTPINLPPRGQQMNLGSHSQTTFP
jgi:hypothetical protein